MQIKYLGLTIVFSFWFIMTIIFVEWLSAIIMNLTFIKWFKKEPKKPRYKQSIIIGIFALGITGIILYLRMNGYLK